MEQALKLSFHVFMLDCFRIIYRPITLCPVCCAKNFAICCYNKQDTYQSRNAQIFRCICLFPTQPGYNSANNHGHGKELNRFREDFRGT